MKKASFLLVLLVTISGILLTSMQVTPPTPALTSREIMNTMIAKVNALKTLQFNMKSWERIKGKDHYSDADSKLNVNPIKLYIHSNAEPNKDVEILYNPALYGTKAKVNPGKFLPTLSMDLYGSRMRKDQHHPMTSSGFAYLGRVLAQALKKADTEAKGQFETLFKYEGEVAWDGHQCYKITITDPTFKWVDYTLKPGEDIHWLEANKYICGWLVVEKNNLGDFFGSKPGQTLKIPTTYAQKTTLLIDKQTYLPIVQTMYDEQGQFERYEFHKLVVNPAFTDKDFSTDGPGYKF